MTSGRELHRAPAAALLAAARRLRRAGRPAPAIVRRCCLAALIANVGIVVTGGAVRLTSSGLGCPTWPRCTTRSFTPAASWHGYVEFGNRMLTFVLTAVIVACVVATLRSRPRRRDLVVLSFALVLGVVAQAVLGGVTVRTGLNPLTVAAHFLLSMLLIAAAVLLHVRSGEGDAQAVPLVRPQFRLLGAALTAVVALTLIVGTIVTGSGPHSGDPKAHRLPFAPVSVTQLHADLVFLLVGLSVSLVLALAAVGAPALLRRRARTLLLLVLAQGVVGYVQYFTDLPIVLVAAHILGATLVWIAALRVLLAMRERAAAAPGPALTPVPAVHTPTPLLSPASR